MSTPEIRADLPAFCYNADIRNNGTARRVKDAADRHFGVPLTRYTRPCEVNDEHPLYIFIDDGRDDIPMDVPHPNACWLIDSHLGYDTRLEWAFTFDRVYCAQLPSVGKMRQDGVEAEWLPLACHPSVDPNVQEFLAGSPEVNAVTKEYDIGFVGFLNDDEEGNSRIDYLDTLYKAFPESWLAFNKFFVDAAMRYHRARLGFNISIRDDLNMRFFEVMSYGTALLSNRDVVGVEELGFVDGEHYIGFEGKDEMVERAEWALKNPIEREKIAEAGHKKVRESHTYAHRLETLLGGNGHAGL